tara:strand:+ start:1771 stop:2085 length:315 start_codon:yes stop_codon:yes gene_type:complete
MTENYLKCYDIANSTFINIPGINKKNSPSYSSESFKGISSHSGLFWTWKDYSATDNDNDADYYYFDLSGSGDSTYTITPSATTINEGETVTTSISTTKRTEILD